MKVQWSFGASDDLRNITAFVGFHNPRAASELDTLLSEAVAKLTEFPMLGRVGRLAGTREILAHRHYRIVYTIIAETVRIEAVVHTSRQWPPEPDGDA